MLPIAAIRGVYNSMRIVGYEFDNDIAESFFAKCVESNNLNLTSVRLNLNYYRSNFNYYTIGLFYRMY